MAIDLYKRAHDLLDDLIDLTDIESERDAITNITNAIDDICENKNLVQCAAALACVLTDMMHTLENDRGGDSPPWAIGLEQNTPN